MPYLDVKGYYFRKCVLYFTSSFTHVIVWIELTITVAVFPDIAFVIFNAIRTVWD